MVAGKSVSLGFVVDDDALVFSARTSPRDLEFGLKLIAAYLTDPAYRADSLSEARVIISTEYAQMNTAPGGQIFSRLERLLSGDARFGLPESDQLGALSLEELRAKAQEVREELFGARVRQATGQLENTAKLGQLRKDVARVETILREKQEAQP